jgi:hypothetical protein
MSIPTDKIAEFLAEVIADRHQTAADKDRAATALKFYATKEAEANLDRPGVDPEVVENCRRVTLSYGREGAKMLWYFPEDCVFSSYTGTDGIVHQRVASKEFGGLRPNEFYPSATEPAPGPAPEFIPAVPLPVMQVSDVEKAVNESSLTFDERYSPGAVAARVAAIEKEAAVIRRMREQTE